MSRKKILVLSASHLWRNPRVLKEAATLSAAGYDVTVMSVSAVARYEAMDLDLMRHLPFTRKVLDYTGGDRASRVASVVQRGATWSARLLCRQFQVELAQALGPAAALLRFARREPADLTIAHTEIPLWAAPHLMRAGRRVAVDLEDWYSQDLLYADRLNRPLRLLERAERYALNHAAYASVPSDSMAAALAESYRCPRPITIRNTFPLQARTRLDRPLGSEPPAFIWFSQTIGPGRGLEPFLAAWAQTRTPSRVHLLGEVSASYREHLLSLVPADRRTGLAFIPPVTPEELPVRLTEFDVGLALESREPRNRDITLSNKLFQYMNAGLAIIATDTSGQCEVMRAAPAVGLLVSGQDAAILAARLDELIGNPDRLRAAQTAARAAAVREFSWEHDAPRLLAAVDRALAQPIAPPA